MRGAAGASTLLDVLLGVDVVVRVGADGLVLGGVSVEAHGDDLLGGVLERLDHHIGTNGDRAEAVGVGRRSLSRVAAARADADGVSENGVGGICSELERNF